MQRNRSGGWTAKLAACLFLFQALIVGFSLGAHAEPLPRDQFGNVICTTAEDGSGGGADHSSHHAGQLDCCTVGCTMHGGHMALPPIDFTLVSDPTYAFVAPFVLYEDVGSGAVETPRQTRGPPLSI